MREILFRGKAVNLHNGSKDFVYGQYVQNRDGKMIYSDTWEDGIQKHYVIEETVGQYTGLTDKNGKKIFEGDILEYEHTISGFYIDEDTAENYKPRRSHSCYWNDKEFHYKRNYAVEWKGKDARFILRNDSDQHDLRQTSLTMHNGTIIGNIHDNPELLGGNDNA